MEKAKMEDKKMREIVSRKLASKRYLKDKVEDIRIRVPKGEKVRIQQRAETVGKSVNSYIVELINADMLDSMDIPNDTTVKAIRELDSGHGQKWTGSTEDLVRRLAGD